MSKRNLQAVLHEAADHGLKVFHAKPGEKGPRNKRWKDRATSDKIKLSNMAISFPNHTFGVLADGVTVIDLDVKPEESLDGIAEWKARAVKNGADPYTTPMRETHGGGMHLYFQGNEIYDRTKLLEGVGEYRTNNDFCVIWRDGKEYSWAEGYSPEEIDFQPVPAWVSTLTIKNGSKDYSTLAEVWLSDQNAKTYYHSCELFRAGQSLAQVEFTMLGKWGAGGMPDLDPEKPWTKADILSTVASAHQAEGKKNTSSKVSLVEGWGEPKTAAYALNNPLPEKQCLVEGLIYSQEVSVTFAPPGFLKSLLWLDLGVHVAGGTPWLPQNVLDNANVWQAGTIEVESALFEGYETQQTTVLYLDFDQGAHRVQERLAAHLRGSNLGADTPLLYYSVPIPWLKGHDEKMMEELGQLISKLGVGLTIVDTLSTTSIGVEENSSAMQEVLVAWRRIAEYCKCHVSILHHSSKAGGYRGSSAIQAGVDLMIEMERIKGDKQSAIVRCDKTRGAWFPPFGATYEFTQKPETKVLESVSFYRKDIDPQKDEETKVYELVKTCEGQSQKAVYIACKNEGISQHRAKELLEALQTQGRLTSDKVGKALVWALPEKKDSED